MAVVQPDELDTTLSLPSANWVEALRRRDELARLAKDIAAQITAGVKEGEWDDFEFALTLEGVCARLYLLPDRPVGSLGEQCLKAPLRE
jgi:hypothetical protein